MASRNGTTYGELHKGRSLLKDFGNHDARHILRVFRDGGLVFCHQVSVGVLRVQIFARPGGIGLAQYF